MYVFSSIEEYLHVFFLSALTTFFFSPACACRSILVYQPELRAAPSEALDHPYLQVSGEYARPQGQTQAGSQNPSGTTQRPSSSDPQDVAGLPPSSKSASQGGAGAQGDGAFYYPPSVDSAATTSATSAGKSTSSGPT